MDKTSLRVGILGATGSVGQRFVELLSSHPWFEITALAASERSAGKSYREAANWMGQVPLPEAIAQMEVQHCEPGLDCDLVFSGLSSSVAGPIEEAFREAGYAVISNAKNHRMDEDVPLLIPEINADHASLIDRQLERHAGFIATNPNCSTVGLVCALKPLVDAVGVDHADVVTLQALSGAGYPGVASLDAVANVVPYIGGEEEKMATEPKKLLGTLAGEAVEPHALTVSATCTRVPVVDGHTECITVRLRREVTTGEVEEIFRAFRIPETVDGLPSAPRELIRLHTAPDAPQPRRHAQIGRGMTVSVGRVRSVAPDVVKFVALVHNTVRGAAGVAILNAEHLVREGYVQRTERLASSIAS